MFSLMWLHMIIVLEYEKNESLPSEPDLGCKQGSRGAHAPHSVAAESLPRTLSPC